MASDTVSVQTRRRRREPLAVHLPRMVVADPAPAPAPGPECGPASSAAILLAAELEELTRSELIALVPEPRSFGRMVPSDLFGRLLRRGMDVRVLHGLPADGEPTPFPTLARVGIAASTTFALPYPVIVRDRAVMYMPHPDPTHPLANQMAAQSHAVAARSLAFAFDLAWSAVAAAVPGASPAPPPDSLISAEQREILQVLSSGLTDEHAAAQLHISRRTFARRLAALMEALGATSRFQVGAQAVRHGVI
jgi:DNA-binding CsgD family transcriptional regulator